VPGFLNDFKDYPGHQSIILHCTKEFREQPRNNFDLVILVPHIGEAMSDLYHKSVLLKYINGAKFVLLNFETPNWFNQLSPEKRSPALWNNWKQVSLIADLVLSSSIEGNRYARKFYLEVPSSTLFRHCYPSINSLLADKVIVRHKRKQIICFTRFGKGNTHKGGTELLKAAAPAIAGCELVVVIGSGFIKPELEKKFHNYAEDNNFSVRFLYNLTDKEKFKEIKQSTLMLFLSFFEGFGYPPIEAIYSGIPCIAYDLPVLREICGDLLYYVRRGDEIKLQKMILEILQKPPPGAITKQKKIAPIACFQNYEYNLNAIISQLFTLSQSRLSYDPLYHMFWDWYWQIFNELKNVEQNLEVEKAEHRLTQRKFLKLQNKLEQLRNDPIVRIRFALGRRFKRLIPKLLLKNYREKFEKFL